MSQRFQVTRRRAIAVVVALVVLAGAGVGVWVVTRSGPDSVTRFATATTTTLRQTVSSSGAIEPAQRANLNFAVSGQVTSVVVAVGQRVSTGQPLATVNSATLAAAAAQANASVAAAQAKFSDDQRAGASAAQLSADQATIDAVDNQLTNARDALAEATLTAPISGVVAAVHLTVGQQVSAGGAGTGIGAGAASAGTGTSGTGGPGSSAAQIVVMSIGSYIVNASVDDTEVGQVRTGDQAVITPDGATTPVYGTVTSVAMLASGSSVVPSYPVTIRVTGSPAGLFAGAGATVSIIVQRLTDVLVVPTAAVHYHDGTAEVYQLVNGKRVSRPVTVGLTVGGQTQILSGLSDGDQVILPSGSGNRGTAVAGTRGAGGGFGGGFRGGFGGPGGRAGG